MSFAAPSLSGDLFFFYPPGPQAGPDAAGTAQMARQFGRAGVDRRLKQMGARRRARPDVRQRLRLLEHGLRSRSGG